MHVGPHVVVDVVVGIVFVTHVRWEHIVILEVTLSIIV